MDKQYLPGCLHQPPAPTDDRELLCVKNLAGLLLRMLRPWTYGVEPYVGKPVPQRASSLTLPLIRERQIVMSVGILRNQGDSFLVGRSRLGQALHLIKHIAEVEKGECILGVGQRRTPVVLLG